MEQIAAFCILQGTKHCCAGRAVLSTLSYVSAIRDVLVPTLLATFALTQDLSSAGLLHACEVLINQLHSEMKLPVRLNY